MDEQGFTRAQGSQINQACVGGRINNRKSGPDLEIHGFGQRVHLVLRDADPLGERAKTAVGENTITHLNAPHAFADFDHPARGLTTRNEGQVGLLLIFPLEHQQIRKITTRRLHREEHLARPRPALGHFRDP